MASWLLTAKNNFPGSTPLFELFTHQVVARTTQQPLHPIGSLCDSGANGTASSCHLQRPLRPHRSLYMCDYSLMQVLSRPAKIGALWAGEYQTRRLAHAALDPGIWCMA